MTFKKFMESAPALQIDVDGNTLRVCRACHAPTVACQAHPVACQLTHARANWQGEPRSFASGSVGWYLGGKVPISVGSTTVWAQVGMNVVIPGSGSWKK